MVTASVVLVVAATLTLVIGIIAGMDSLIFTSIASSVIAGALLIKSVLDDRKTRLATDGPSAWTPTPGPTTTYSPSRVEEQPTSVTIPEVEEEPQDAEEVELDQAAVIVGGGDDGNQAQEAAEAPKPKTSARSTAAKSTAKKAAAPAKSSAKKTAAKAKPAAKPKAAAKSPAAKPKSSAKPASAKGAGAPAKSAAKKTTAKPKTAAKKPTAKPKTAGSKVVPAPGEE